MSGSRTSSRCASGGGCGYVRAASVRIADAIGPDLRLGLLELDPGLAFGTGTHATTALCLEWLDSGADNRERRAKPWLAGADVIDYGCGSGILAIAALRLGARRAVAMDIDPQALLATRENAERNGVLDRVQVTADREVEQAAGRRAAGQYPGRAAGRTGAPAGRSGPAPGGRIALSGLLVEQADAVTAAYRPWFDIGLTGARDGWGLLTGCRRAQDDVRRNRITTDVFPVS